MSQGAFPYPQDRPTGRAQSACHVAVALRVPRELRRPKSHAGFRRASVARAAMPKAAVHKHGDFLRAENEIWLAGQRRSALPAGDATCERGANRTGSEKCLQPMNESAAIAVMPTTIQEIELQVVIQFGGTSKEQYLHSFLNEAAARRFIRSADKASYRCLGPFPLLLPGIRELADVASDTIEWLQSNGFRDTPLANNLNSALAQVEREYPLT